MRVEFYGIYRTMAAGKSLEFDSCTGLTVRDILKNVGGRFPALMNELFDERGELYPYIPLYVNGRNPRLLEHGLDSPLEADDVLSLFSPISSGRMNVEVLRSK